jgi:hypothetical protein
MPNLIHRFFCASFLREISGGAFHNKQQSLITSSRRTSSISQGRTFRGPYVKYRLMPEEVFAAEGDFIPVSKCFMTLLFFGDFLQ